MDKYNEFIINIINTRGRFNCDGYHERHHIIPKCLGGNDENNNLIDLYAKEHYIAHKLLAEENPDNLSLTYAWWMMCHCTKNKNNQEVRYIVDEEEYEESRKAYSKALSEMNKNRKVSEETRCKISQSVSGENNPFYGKRHSDETKFKISKANSGRHLSEETCHKISESNIGRICSEETKEKLSRARKGKKMSEETKNKLSEIAKGRNLSDETRKKIGESLKGEKSPRYGKGKMVKQLSLDGSFISEYQTVTFASSATGVDATSIIKVCKHKQKTAGGFLWEYVAA